MRTQAYNDKAASKQIMGRWDHQGDRENGKRRFVPRDQGLLYLSFTVHYVNKKKIVPRQYYAFFICSFPILRN